MEIKKFFKNRNKFVELDQEEFNKLNQDINFIKENENSPLFLNKSKEKKQ